MRISAEKPFKIIYSIYFHEYLGYLFELFVVQLNEKGNLTWEFQSLSSRNVDEFAAGLDEKDVLAVKFSEKIKPLQIYEDFNTQKKNSLEDFYLKTWHKETGDKELQQQIYDFVEQFRSKVFNSLFPDKKVFIMGNDGNPMKQEINVEKEPVEILFHFIRNEDNTHYFPTLKLKGKKLEFQYKNALILNDEPAWMLLDNHLYHFKPELEGKKLKPFLNKKFVAIPQNMEEDYYRKFVKLMVARYPISASGFEIIQSEKNISLLISYGPLSSVQIEEDENLKKKKAKEDELNEKWQFTLSFQYGNNRFPWDNLAAEANVLFAKKGDSFSFEKINRSIVKEKRAFNILKNAGLPLKLNGKAILGRGESLKWLSDNKQVLDEAGFILNFKGDGQVPRYFLGKPNISIRIGEKLDWFDIQAVISFGEHQIPFLKIRQLILQGKQEFHLPDGSIAVIPENWFEEYHDLFYFAENQQGGNGIILKKQHFQLVEEWSNQELIETTHRENLFHINDLLNKEYPIPKQFKGQLRPYQLDGYRWMKTHQKARLGACLADDMGLGKTIQTLCLLQSLKEEGEKLPHLLIMPTSLLHNWQIEAKKFTPQLKVLIYNGSNREKLQVEFKKYDLIVTSFGMVRSDIDWFTLQEFGYIILDESQAIKNPSALITKSVNKLKSKYRLVMTGTPLENSTVDLWSQMNFINPGLLGTLKYFKDNFLVPIEKKGDEEKKERLFKLIKPYLLRRDKRQVAKDLPEKIETISFCSMSEEQEELYNKTKNFYRESILKQIKEDGLNKSKFSVLQGLTKLRQIANHPVLSESDYSGDSGKMEMVIDKLETVLEHHHKVLIFSQFVQHLQLIKDELEKRKIKFCYLDGSTSDRKSVVDDFQRSDGPPVFLISLKAGGVGLNLTEADYVFLLDPWWNPAAEAQAVDRAHRIGQKNTVFTYKFITKETVEEKILALQQKKSDLADALINQDESLLKSMKEEDLLELLS
ncbi:MAG: hypothetical protein RIR51_1701 [Bacteroidota bacterium]